MPTERVGDPLQFAACMALLRIYRRVFDVECGMRVIGTKDFERIVAREQFRGMARRRYYKEVEQEWENGYPIVPVPDTYPIDVAATETLRDTPLLQSRPFGVYPRPPYYCGELVFAQDTRLHDVHEWRLRDLDRIRTRPIDRFGHTYWGGRYCHEVQCYA